MALTNQKNLANNETHNVVTLTPGKDSARGQMLEVLFKEYSPALRRFLRVRQIAEADQEDVLQTVFLKLARMEDLTERLSARPDTIKNYLITISINVIRDNLRRAQVRKSHQHSSLADHEQPSVAPGPEKTLHLGQNVTALKKVLLKMKKKHRQAFMLSRFQGLSYRETANELGVSVSTVEKYISAALVELRKELLP